MFDNLIMRLKYKFRICQQKGCWKHGDEITECFLPDYEIDDEGFRVDEKPDEYYCTEHAARNGYCKSCGEFWGGIESFEFEHPGWCDNCHDQMEHDFNIGGDGDEWDLVDWNDDPYDAQQSFAPDTATP